MKPVTQLRLAPFLLFLALAGPSDARADAPGVGVLIPMSGQFAELGEQCRWGVEAARAALGTDAPAAAKPAFIYEDSQADPKTAISAFRRLVDEKKVVSVVTIRSPIGLAVNPISAQARVPVLGAVAHPKFVAGNPYAFQMWAQTDAEGAAIANGMLKVAGKKAAIVTAEDDWLIALSAKAREKFVELGGTIVMEDSVPPAETDLAMTMTKVKAAKVDAVFLDLTVPQLGASVKKLRELGYAGSIFSNFWASLPDVQRSAGAPGMNGVYFPEMEVEHPKFRAEVERSFPGKRPTAATFSCYTAAAAAISAVSAVGSGADREAVYRKLLAMGNVPLLDGMLTMKERVGQYSVLLKQIHDGKVQLAKGAS